ncbi:MAG TPA: DNA repair protein RecN [Candidatus Lumbricidophila sp.]|nr:DNA repair protein RecN [Candidatus Lumbricidophila sp.]
MIEDLGIRDLGVIAEATLPLGPGFTAVTGETGAGKTMVVTALGLLLGARADSAAVRGGAAQAWVDGRWSVPHRADLAERVAEAGGVLEDGELILGRSVSNDGRSRAVIGGRSAPVGVLGELGASLVVVHGQADQQRLRSAVEQRAALDRFVGAALDQILGEYRAAFEAWRADTAELERLTAEHDARVREAAELRALIDEIEAVDPQPGEDRELAERIERLTNLEELRAQAGLAHDALAGGADELPGASALIDQARRALERAGTHDPALSAIAETLGTIGYALTDAATELGGYLASLDETGARDLDTLNDRRAALSALTRRHGSLDAALELRELGGLRLVELDGDDDRIELLRSRVATSAEEAGALAEQLTALRRAGAEQLSVAVSAELTALAMPHAVLTAEIDATGDLRAHGRDEVTLLLRPHPGAEPRPIAKAASGGELSRVMLALEVVMASDVPTFVFDEIDAGVGGAAAIEIGRRLAKLAEHAQVIVVTHLAQVAAFATNHLAVVKDTNGEVTESSVRQLRGPEREAEMARLLSGLSDSSSALEHARELLALSQG